MLFEHLCTRFKLSRLVLSQGLPQCHLRSALFQYRHFKQDLVQRFCRLPKIAPVAHQAADNDAELCRITVHQELPHFLIAAEEALHLLCHRNFEFLSQFFIEAIQNLRLLQHHRQGICMTEDGIPHTILRRFSLPQVVLPGLQRGNHVRQETLYSGFLLCPMHRDFRSLPLRRCILHPIVQPVRSLLDQIFQAPQGLQRILFIQFRLHTILLLQQCLPEIIPVLKSLVLQGNLRIDRKIGRRNIRELIGRNPRDLPQDITEHAAAHAVALSQLGLHQSLIQKALCPGHAVLLQIGADILLHPMPQISRRINGGHLLISDAEDHVAAVAAGKHQIHIL